MPSWMRRVVLSLVARIVPRAEREFLLGDLEERRPSSWAREVKGALSLALAARGRRPRAPKPRRDPMLSSFVQDLRHALRLMRRDPGFTAVAVVTLALGIGANTAMFSLVNGVLLRPLPYPAPDRLVDLRETNLARGFTAFQISPATFLDWQARNRTFARMAAYRQALVTFTGGDYPRMLLAYRVGDGFLEMLGAAPSPGRGFTPDEFLPGHGDVVVVSHGFWQQALGGASDVVGRAIALDGAPVTVAGVLPREWRPPFGAVPDVVLPLRPEPWWQQRGSHHMLRAVARLAPGVTHEQAQADLSAVARALAQEYPETDDGWDVAVTPLDVAVTGGVRRQLLLLQAIVGLVLLVACANVGNMTLARAARRRQELAVRSALGAGRGRIARQLLAESLLVSLAGGLAGILPAYGALRLLAARWPTLLPRMADVSLDLPVLLFTSAVALGSAVLFGLLPAVAAGRSGPGDALGRNGPSLTGGRVSRRVRGGLVAAEVALAVPLLVGSGLLIRSFAALQAERPGFETDHRVLVDLRLPQDRYGAPERRAAFADAVLERVGALPGVRSAAVTSLVPVSRLWNEINAIEVERRAEPPADRAATAFHYRVTADYFDVMGIPLVAGRGFSDADRQGRPLVAIVSEALARRHFGDASPIGARIRDDEAAPWMEIVGVAGEVQHAGLGQSSLPQYYTPFAQTPGSALSVVIHAAVPPRSLADAARAAIGRVDPDLPLIDLQPMTEMVASSISLPRFRTLLMAAFGLVALLLAAVGLYGVISCVVAERSKEIGIRMALGATRGVVLTLVLASGAPMVAAGLALGLGGALASARLLQSLLFGVGATDPATFLAAPALLAAVAVVAMVVPARRATRVDPILALRAD